MKRIVVLISGRGSNLLALHESLNTATKQGQHIASVKAVISNEPAAAGLLWAADQGIHTAVINHRSFKDRDAFDIALAGAVADHEPDLVVLAGFMRVLGQRFVQAFSGRLINIHPSLLPAFPGLHTHERALAAGVCVHGASVHFVTETLDGGPIIAQAVVPVRHGDNAQILAQRVLALEHRLLPQVVIDFSLGLVRLDPAGRLRASAEAIRLMAAVNEDAA